MITQPLLLVDGKMAKTTNYMPPKTNPTDKPWTVGHENIYLINGLCYSLINLYAKRVIPLLYFPSLYPLIQYYSPYLIRQQRQTISLIYLLSILLRCILCLFLKRMIKTGVTLKSYFITNITKG